jgi:cell wall-associated NlpC family hydrolase
MTASELLSRARSAAGKKIKYKLGGGGMTPTAPSPANINQECDCSGFVCWALQLKRQTDHPLYVNFNGGWINTDAMVNDANHQTGFFARLDAPRVGCLIVFPSKKPAIKVGHVGIVTAVAGGKATKVIHCSNGNFKTAQDAIGETPPTVFNKPQTIYAWYAGVE